MAPSPSRLPAEGKPPERRRGRPVSLLRGPPWGRAGVATSRTSWRARISEARLSLGEFATRVGIAREPRCRGEASSGTWPWGPRMQNETEGGEQADFIVNADGD